MDPVERLVKEYRDADDDCRLELFLMYRDLRDRFRAIEAGSKGNMEAPVSPFPREFLDVSS
jgi:hypothetical protein